MDDTEFGELILSTLEWRETNAASDLAAYQLDAVHVKIDEMIPTLPSTTLIRLKALGNKHWERLLLAPALHYDVMSRNGSVARGALALYIAAESASSGDLHAFAEIGIPNQTVVSTALGDRTWILQSVGTTEIVSPSIGGVVIDCNSCHARKDWAGFGPLLAAYDSTEIQALRNNTGKAIEQIGEGNRVAGSLLTSLLRVVLIRKNDSFVGAASSSWPKLPGCIGLINPLHMSCLWLMNALVHESVHTFLYLHEFAMKWYSDPAVNTSHIILSPWTARPLPAHSFIHACLVWYALLNFWSSTRLAGAEDFARAAALGFRRTNSLIAELDKIPGLRPVIRELVAHVCELGSLQACNLY
jgi:hypothetical protein